MAAITASERECAARLRRHVTTLAGGIGGRSLHRFGSLDEAPPTFTASFQATAIYRCDTHSAPARATSTTSKREATKGSWSSAPITTPQADSPEPTTMRAAWQQRSNSPARAGHDGARTLRFVFFANEEPPYFQTPSMGSYVYARRCRESNEPIHAMLSLETIGYYSDAPGSQTYLSDSTLAAPPVGNFLGFVSDLRTGLLLRRVLKIFRSATALATQGAAAPASIAGVSWSDHWSFWQFGYRAVMVTDTAPFRYPHYHRATDTPDKLDYDRLAQAVTGLRAVAVDLATG